MSSLDDALMEAGRRVGLPLYSKFDVLRDRLYNIEYGWWAGGFRYGNDHGPNHIKRVLERVSELLGPDPLAELGPYELFLTMMSVLYHDVGLMRGRGDHAAVSALLVAEETNEYIVQSLDREIIESAVASHSSDTDIAKATAHFGVEVLVGNQRVRPQVIAALLRIADELDEDQRRADELAQSHLQVPATSQFYWEFSRRIGGIRPSHETKTIDIQVRLQPDDVGRLILKDDQPKSFVAAFAGKLAKINRERVYVNRFLPRSLRYHSLSVAVRVADKASPMNTPRTFTFVDHSTGQDFLAYFPELFAVPTASALHGMLGSIRRGDLTTAASILQSLDPLVADLSNALALSILYDGACVNSRRAATTGDTVARDTFLNASVEYLRRWWGLGDAGAFDERGASRWNEIHRLGIEVDLREVLAERRREIVAMFPERYRGALPEDPPPDGISGCVVAGTLIRTPSGHARVEDLRVSDRVLSVVLPSLRRQTSTISVITSLRQTTVIEVGHAKLSPAQPVLLADGRWVRADKLGSSQMLMGVEPGGEQRASPTASSGYFVTYNIELGNEPHTYLANDVICHNKRPDFDLT